MGERRAVGQPELIQQVKAVHGEGGAIDEQRAALVSGVALANGQAAGDDQHR
jgi:hypothetical protein